MLSIFIEMTLWHGFSPVDLLHVFRTPFQGTSLEDCFGRAASGDYGKKPQEIRPDVSAVAAIQVL